MAENTADTPSPKKKTKRWPIVTGVVVAVLVVAGAGMWVWHEQPSFCGAICHTPMETYLPTYEAEPGQPATDKWGNEVSDASSMLAASHRSLNGDTCLSCHVPTLDEQIAEGMNWVTGNYYYPLDERTDEDLTEARGLQGDDFCLNEACHAETRADLKELTADMGQYNPHNAQHGELARTTCHKAHRASVMYCAQCHDDAEVPEGWVAGDEGDALEDAAMAA